MPEADKVELQAIEEVYCKGREDPLLIGSVMSNIGYNEAASGITAITKVSCCYNGQTIIKFRNYGLKPKSIERTLS